MRDTFGPYRIVKKIGEGGMGAVYVAHDPRLERDVALKVIRAEAAGTATRERFLREARAAARVNHPNVCQIYETGEADGEPYFVMELLEGEPLSRRLEKGALPVAESLRIALEVLSALEALHARGVVHRDLKPGNVFLSTHGVKVLDFGLARPAASGDRTELRLTQSGIVMGTPRYMAPEQWEGAPGGPASDLFALGALLFEMLAGHPAFGGSTLPEICCAVLTGRPPTLTGGPEIMAVDKILDRALQRNARDRYASAEDMARAVRAALEIPGTGSFSMRAAKAVTRFAALPLRILRPDPETDFLALSVAEEVASSLAGLESVVVRSTSAAARVAGEPPDLKRLASELEVDAVLTGTLLRAGEALRVGAQLVEVPAGTVKWSKSSTVKLGDLFSLLEDLSRQIVDGLRIQLSPRDRRAMEADVPSSPAAYEKYLRANQLNISTAETAAIRQARALYEASVAEDPSYAPAWARLGRVYRIMAKYGLSDRRDEAMRLAGEAFRKALSINPDLPLAHNLYTNYEVEELGRTGEALDRLLDRAKRGAVDPNLFAGLTYVLRFAGLLDASLAADERARRLDPGVRTSAHYTLLMKRDFERAIERDHDQPPAVKLFALALLGRREEARNLIKPLLSAGVEGLEANFLEAQLALAENRLEDAKALFRSFSISGFSDPEGLYLCAVMAAQAGDPEMAGGLFLRSVEKGFYCLPAFQAEPELAALHGSPPVDRALELAGRRHEESVRAFSRAGGARILGLTI